MVRQKMFQATEEIGPKFTGERRHIYQRISPKKIVEELLSQVFGIARGETLSPDESIQRVPINRTQIGQGLSCFRSCLVAGRQDHTPVRRLEHLMCGRHTGRTGFWRHAHSFSARDTSRQEGYDSNRIESKFETAAEF